MRLGPRAKLLVLAALFALPIAASLITYRHFRPAAGANYGELLLPPWSFPAHDFKSIGDKDFAFAQLKGRWVLVTSDSGACPDACRAKLAAMRQIRLALGRNASRVERVLVVDDIERPDSASLAPFSGTDIVLTPRGLVVPPGPANDRAHIYLADPLGNVMMRWPANPDYRGMFKDLERLLKASQIG